MKFVQNSQKWHQNHCTHFGLLSLLLTLNRLYKLLCCFHCWLWASMFIKLIILKLWKTLISLDKLMPGNGKWNCQSINGWHHCLWQWADQRFILGHLPAGICLLKINNINNRARCEICSKLTIKTPEWCYWHRSAVFIVNFEHISHLVLVFLLLIWAGKYRLRYKTLTQKDNVQILNPLRTASENVFF